MTTEPYASGIWFIYDGECPICNYAAHALRLQQQYGELHLVDARDDQNHPLLLAVNANKLDLDEGMVIVCNGRFYHGASALEFMARHGDDKGAINHANRLLFRSPRFAALLYPWMRKARNALLRLRRKEPINNLK